MLTHGREKCGGSRDIDVPEEIGLDRGKVDLDQASQVNHGFDIVSGNSLSDRRRITQVGLYQWSPFYRLPEAGTKIIVCDWQVTLLMQSLGRM